jgi:hypothetical protein
MKILMEDHDGHDENSLDHFHNRSHEQRIYKLSLEPPMNFKDVSVHYNHDDVLSMEYIFISPDDKYMAVIYQDESEMAILDQ